MDGWNPYLERLDRTQLTWVQLFHFRNLLGFAKQYSRLYRDKLKDLDPDRITTLDALKRIPLTDKTDLRKYQELPPYPYGGILAGNIEQVTTYRQTSGTTGKPVYVPEPKFRTLKIEYQE